MFNMAFYSHCCDHPAHICALIYYLVSVKILHVSMKINGCIFLYREIHTHIHYIAKLMLNCYLLRDRKMFVIVGKIQHLQTFISTVLRYYKRIGVITFEATLFQEMNTVSCTKLAKVWWRLTTWTSKGWKTG